MLLVGLEIDLLTFSPVTEFERPAADRVRVLIILRVSQPDALGDLLPDVLRQDE